MIGLRGQRLPDIALQTASDPTLLLNPVYEVLPFIGPTGQWRFVRAGRSLCLRDLKARGGPGASNPKS